MHGNSSTAIREGVNNVRTLHEVPEPAALQAARQRHPAGSALTPFTAAIISTARFIAERRLPEGDISFVRDMGVVIDLSKQPHPMGAVRIWAKALGADGDVITDVTPGSADRSVTAFLPDGTWVRVVARQVTR